MTSAIKTVEFQVRNRATGEVREACANDSIETVYVWKHESEVDEPDMPGWHWIHASYDVSDMGDFCDEYEIIGDPELPHWALTEQSE